MIHLITFLASAEPAAESEGIAALGMDPLTMLAQGITFVIFFFIIKKFAFDKIVKTLEDRRVTIEKSLNDAEELKLKNEAAEERIKKLLQDARQEAETIIDKSNQEAGSIVSQAEDAAAVKAQKIIDDGVKNIENEVLKARADLKKETLGLVAQATEALLGEKINASKHEALVKKALDEAKK